MCFKGRKNEDGSILGGKEIWMYLFYGKNDQDVCFRGRSGCIRFRGKSDQDVFFSEEVQDVCFKGKRDRDVSVLGEG